MSDLVEMIHENDTEALSPVYVTRGNMANLIRRGWKEKKEKKKVKSI